MTFVLLPAATAQASAKQTDAEQQRWQWLYSDEGELAQVTNPLGATTFYESPATGETLVVLPDGAEATYASDERGNLLSVVDGRKRSIVAYRYDPRGLLLAHFDVMDEWFNHPDYKGCMFVLACAEFPVATDPIHRRAAKSFDAAEEQARGLARAAGVRDPEAFARTYMMLIEGALTRRLVTRGSQEVHLTPTEYDLLKALATQAGRVLTHGMLLRAVWGSAYEHDAPTLRVFITQLRRKIEADPAHPVHILTEPGIGYRFSSE